MIFLENPAKRRKRKATAKRKRKRRPPKGFRSWKAYMASIRPGAKRKRKRRKAATKAGTTKRRRRRRRAATTTTGGKMARRKRRSTRRRAASRPRRRRRSYRRNPPLLRAATKGAMDGAAICAGKALTRVVSSRLPMVPRTGPLGLLAQLAVATGVAHLAGRFAPARHRAMMQAGAFASVIEDAVVALNVPVISSALDAYPLSLNAYPDGLSALEYESADDLPAFAAIPEDGMGQSAMYQ